MLQQIFDELLTTNSTKEKEQILRKYKDNQLLREVLYHALSPRVKFYIKKIPDYVGSLNPTMKLNDAITELQILSSRQFTGNAAIDYLRSILSSLSEFDAFVIERIIEKDIKLGFNVSTTNKVWPKLIEETPYMGASSFDKKKIQKLIDSDKKGIVSQIKMDGRYCNLINTHEEVITESRSGEITHIFNTFDELFCNIPERVFNGELIMDGINRYESNGIIASIVDICKKEKNGNDISKEKEKFTKKHELDFEDAINKIIFVTWDVITIDEYNNAISERDYDERWHELSLLISQINSPRVRLVESKRVANMNDMMEDFKEKLSNGEEGTIIKGLSTKWKDGKPNTQIKVKLEMSMDLVIVGYNQGKKGTRLEQTLGSLICESADGKLKTDPAGLSDEIRDVIWKNRELLLNTTVEIICSGVSVTDNGYSLLHPRFFRLRDDKNSANTLEEILAIEASIKQIN
ncbi:MAG: hypothetical protein PHC28_13435 [Flavobacterium sp.]|uniref:ATP-dependent DNA ligase n=1 Tax=Flavobacterium sp. TaxID=239 RepID=UPI002614D415|nr:hypothetical protein [Flavobacterium sp.]MDD5151455.1 hypothetical protein [Flavobacterium sp.]